MKVANEFSLTHGDKTYSNWTASALAEVGIPAAQIGAAVKRAADHSIGQMMDDARRRIAPVEPGKLAEWWIKQEIARDPAAANTQELVLIDREAAAVGLDRSAFLDMVTAQAVAYRSLALLVAALEAEGKADVAALSDASPLIEEEVADILAGAAAAVVAAIETIAQ